MFNRMRTPIYSRLKNLPMTYKLSILIPTLSSRSYYLKTLLDNISYQIQHKPVEVIWLGDNKSMSIGKKRNALLNMAQGSFISFVDDDDDISDNYVDVLLKAIDDNPDKTVICFHGTQTTDERKDIPFQYNVSFGRNHKKVIDGQRWKVMLPDHLCCWNKNHISEQFPNKSLGEDHEWARKMAFIYNEQDQVLLTDSLYHYKFNRNTTECRR